MDKRQRKAINRSRRIRKAVNIRRNNLPHNTPMKDEDGNILKDNNGKVLINLLIFSPAPKYMQLFFFISFLHSIKPPISASNV